MIIALPIFDLDESVVWVRVTRNGATLWTIADCNKAFARGETGHVGGWE